jgi:hypothetical protein
MLQQFFSSAATKSNSFLEENHSYKLNSQARQSQQVSQPGRPSQDMMSFWGQRHSDSITHDTDINKCRIQI